MWIKRDKRHDVEPRSRGTLYRARERLPWPADRDFRILSIDGGGIRGILPLAFMARLERAYLGGGSIADCFDLSSAPPPAASSPSGLEQGLRPGSSSISTWSVEGKCFPITDGPPASSSVQAVSSLNRCDRRLLDRLIEDILGERRIWESRVRLCIPAAETRYFEPFIFKTPHHPDYRIDWQEPMALAARTTSAAPAFFAPVRNGGYEFVDGGIWANNPTMVGIADALACFDVRRERSTC